MRAAGWTPGTVLFDPMCGSGTLLAEAAQIMCGIPPGAQRTFAFEKFIGYTEAEAKKLHPLHYVFADDREAVLQKLSELSNGISIPYFENRILTNTII